MEEAHASVCGAYQLGHKLHGLVIGIGYYWPTMVCDYIDYDKNCGAG